MFLSALLSIFFVGLTDKTGSQPIAFTQRALQQRTEWAIPTDSLDWEVRQDYLDSLQRSGAKIYYPTRWLNGAVIGASDSLANAIASYSFVRNVQIIRYDAPSSAPSRQPKRLFLSEDSASPLSTDKQLDIYNLRPLHQAGFNGQGILLTVCDVGFQGFDTMPNLHRENCLGKYNLTDDADSINDHSVVHGTYCLSTITGEQEGYQGSATGVQYYLMRSEEIATESPKELYNLVAALEKADSLGVNIFSCSLGYSTFDNSQWNYTYQNMDGSTTPASKAAIIAARKGMLLCISAGNSGNDTWHYLNAPSDADSILCVGAVDSVRNVTAFSSRGPAADGRVKPDVCAMGQQTALLSPKGGVIRGNGTSFSCPLIAGLAASLWSAFPKETAMQIRQRILLSADQLTQPDADYGYGIPDAWAAYQNIPNQLTSPTIQTNVHKRLHNGRLVILRDSQTYDLLGRPLSQEELYSK